MLGKVMHMEYEGRVSLQAIKSSFAASTGIGRKRQIKSVAEALMEVSGFDLEFSKKVMLGDDAAVIPHGDKHLLLAADGINLDIIEDLYWAGYCSVLVNVNDIYAMGGRPTAMVNIIGGSESEIREIVAGMKAGCQKFRVPMVGGHLHPGTSHKEVSVAILGEAGRIMSSFEAREGDDLILAVDLNGRIYKNYQNWDCTYEKDSDEVLRRLEIVHYIAQESLAHAAKDVSNPGILGTIAMLLESSGVGVNLELGKIPVAAGIGIEEWLNFYPGFGFVLSADPGNSNLVCKLFNEVGVVARVIGTVLKEPLFLVSDGTDIVELMDFRKLYVTGLTRLSTKFS